MSARGTGKAARLRPGARMTVYEARALKKRLLAALAGAVELEIDLARVEEMDTAGLQLLLLAKREAQRLGRQLRLTGHSRATLDVLDAYNLGGYFGDPVVLSSRETPAGPGQEGT